MSKLALEGGTPLVEPGTELKGLWPPLESQDIEAVNKILQTREFWGRRSPEIQAFEEEYANTIGVRYCVAMGSGTAALHASIVAAGVMPGDEVIVPALSFLSSATSVLHALAIPIFVDIDSLTYNIDPSKIEEKISYKTKAIMAVHLHGLPCDMLTIRTIAEKHNLVVIEDTAQAQIAEYRGCKVGNLADIAGASIMPAKNFATCGEGGMLTTNRLDYRDRAEMLKMFGETIDASEGANRRYNAVTLGYNYRFNPLQAAFARSQLKRIKEYTDVIVENADYVSSCMRQIPGLIPPFVPSDRSHVYHHYRFYVDPAQAGLDIPGGVFRQAIQDAMGAEGLPLRLYQNMPLPGQQIFQKREGFGHGIPWSLPQARPDATSKGYDISDYPNTLQVLENTLVLGQGSGVHTLFYRDRVQLYIKGLEKVFSDLDTVIRHARNLLSVYQPPWAEAARLS